MNINVSVTDANNIVCQVTPTPQEVVTIDRGVAGVGISSITPVTISTLQYLRITYTNGVVQDVGPLTSTAYFGQTPILITGNTISLTTVPVNLGGTGQTTANAAFNALAPSQTGNSGKFLTTDGTNTSWSINPLGTVTSVNASGGTTGLSFSGGPITTSGTLTLAGILAVANGGTGVTASSGANSVVLRDGNQSIFANNFIPNTTITTASSTPINLTVASAQYQIVNGTITSQQFNLPDATTLTIGETYYFNNNLTYSSVQVNAHDGSTSILALQAGGAAHVVLLSKSTTNGTWDVHSYVPASASWGNATLSFNSASSISGSVSWQGNAVGIAYGGTGQTTANAAFNALAPSQTGNSGKYLTTDGTNTSWAVNPLGTVTSVSATVPSFLSISGSPITTSGTLAIDLSGTALPTTSGGTGLTSFTANGVMYASGTGTLATSSSFTFNGTTVTMTNDASISGLTVGKGAGAVSTNTAVGASALSGSNSGTGRNSAFGLNALATNSTGYYSDAFGMYALYANTTGFSNDAFGYSALFSNTTGSSNVAIGQNALNSNTTASSNTAVGYQAGYTNTTGGVDAFGYHALYNNTTGASNSAFGTNSQLNTTTGGYNVSVGGAALFSNTTANYNTAVGYSSMYSNTTGSGNTIVGYVAGYSNTTGSLNVFIGRQAGYSNTVDQGQTFVGYAAGFSSNANTTSADNTCIGAYAGNNLTTGTKNTFVGGSIQNGGAGYLITTGSKNVILGGYTGNQGGLDIRTASNFIVLSDGDGNPRGVFDGSGNLGLGVTPSAWAGYKPLQAGSGASFGGYAGDVLSFMGSNAYNDNTNWKYILSGNAAARYQQSAGVHAWYTAPSGTAGNAITFIQAMTLDASGNLLVGTTSVLTAGKISVGFNGTSNNGIVFNDTVPAAGVNYALFQSVGTTIGSIVRVAATSAVIYNTTSDYRLKEVIGAVSNSGERIDALQPIDYEWKSDGSRTRGFLAHKFQEVYPNSVSGEKDAVDADGNPVYQTMQASTSEVIADLVAEIKSLRARLKAANIA